MKEFVLRGGELLRSLPYTPTSLKPEAGLVVRVVLMVREVREVWGV